MSRNLNRTNCAACAGRVLPEPGAKRYQRLPEERHCPGMWVISCACDDCGALYTGWVYDPSLAGYRGDPATVARLGFHDLSWRTKFNDEADDADFPRGLARVYRMIIVGDQPPILRDLEIP